MKALRAFRGLLVGLVFTSLLASPCFGFALLGPYEGWMQVSNSFRLSQMGFESTLNNEETTYAPGDIGGPMPVGAEYRWNVPIISYAFDQSFIDYFGAEGLHEVEAAIKLLNKLPPAARIEPTDYPNRVLQANYPAMNEGVFDLKSTTLALLVEQLGLAQPTRSVVILRRTEPSLEGYHSYSQQLDPQWSGYWSNHFYFRNYDPKSYAPGNFVNGALYEFALLSPVWLGSEVCDTVEFPADLLTWGYQAAADGLPNAGYYFTGLSGDDVGGLRYLLNFTNIDFEAPLPDVHRLGAFGLHKVGSSGAPPAAWRPGVDKITFVRHPYFPKQNRSLPLRRRYTDCFFVAGKLSRARVERVIAQPDILFTVDNGEGTPTNHASIYPVTRTGTADWINNAAVNGNPEGPGPGVITPQIRFTFRRLGDQASTAFGLSGFWPPGGFYNAKKAWGSYRLQGRPMTTYPNQNFLKKYTGDMVVRQTRWDVATNSYTPSQAQFWKLPIPAGGMALLQNSVDQTNWITQLTVTNNGGVSEWHCYSSNSAEVFRVVPK